MSELWDLFVVLYLTVLLQILVEHLTDDKSPDEISIGRVRLIYHLLFQVFHLRKADRGCQHGSCEATFDYIFVDVLGNHLTDLH